MNNIEEQYPFIINQVMEYIQEVKKEDRTLSLLDIISDFCMKHDLEVEMVGDAIQSDVYFKSFIEKDCELHRIILTDNQEIEEW